MPEPGQWLKNSVLVAKSYLTLFDPHGLQEARRLCPRDFPARILEWLPFPPPGHLPNSGIEPRSLTSPALADRLFTAEPPEKPGVAIHTIYYIKINN